MEILPTCGKSLNKVMLNFLSAIGEESSEKVKGKNQWEIKTFLCL